MFITENRALIEAVNKVSKQYGITHTFFSDGWIIKLEKNGQTQLIHAYSEFNLNSQASLAAAQDKVCTYELLHSEDIKAAEHSLLSSFLAPKVTHANAQGLIDRYGVVVIKPTHGKGGQYVAKFDDAGELVRYVASHPTVTSWAAVPFIDIQYELRVVVFKGEVVFAYEKHNPTIVNGLKMYNITLGAVIVPVDTATLSEEVSNMAVHAVRSLGLTFAATDIIFDENTEASVLEVNTTFSLERYALTSTAARSNVVDFYVHLIKDLF